MNICNKYNYIFEWLDKMKFLENEPKTKKKIFV